MGFATPEPCLRQTSSVLYIAVDALIPTPRRASLPGLDEFTAALDHEAIPPSRLTSRSRLQFDDARRKHAHTHPFIAEDGCAVYLPEDYFHLRPASDSPRTRKAATLRLGRFTCIPVADGLPAAAEALQTLSQDYRRARCDLALTLSSRGSCKHGPAAEGWPNLPGNATLTTSFSLPAPLMKKSGGS